MNELNAEKKVQELRDYRTKLITKVTYGNDSKPEKRRMVAEVKRLTKVLNLG